MAHSVLLRAAVATLLVLSQGTEAAAPVQHDVNAEMRAWVCEETSESFPSGERILTATPGTALWDAAPACEATNAVHTTCDPATPTVPGMSVASSFGDVGVYLECSDSAQSLLGGLPGVVSECFNGSWTSVSDMCTEGCETPRDCSWVAQTGFTGVLSTDYLVIPEGVPGGQVLSVKCELTSVAHHNDGGWTLVLDQEAGIDILSNLSLWSWHPNNTERPLVMQVRMQTVDGEEIHATYDNVVIDRNTDTFMSVGEYHGTAGDALVPGQNFVNCDPGTCQAVAFTGNAPFWGDYFLEAKTKIFFRPKDYDEPRSCPPLDLHGEGADIPLSRSPGAVVTFWCRHWLMREGPAGGPRVDRGTVTCVNDTSADRPQWDRELALPCTIECPSDFVLANNGTACFHFSSSPVAFGIVEASRKCSVKNASLAIVKDPTDLSHLVNGTYYFTAHTFSKGTMYPEEADLVTNGFMCYGDSGCTSEKWAWNVAVTMDGGFKLNSALANLNYICMLPAWCPESYTEHNGQCYKVLEANSDLPAALATCNEEGSALAYPEDSATVEFLRDLAKRSVIWDNGMTEAQLALGISFEWDDPTIGGMYTISDDLLAAANTSSDDPLALEGLTGRLLTVDRNADTWAFTPTSLFNVTTYAICQYKGPVGCWMAPPTDQNKTTGVQYNNGIVSELVTYNCKPGYFTMGERGNKTVQSLECIGQLGGWWPSDEDYLIPCYGLDVCFDEQTPLPDMSVTNNLTFRYHTFGLSYKCNFASMGMTTLDLRVTQRYTCTEMTNATYNGTHVGEFNYTYGFMPDEDLLHCNRCSVAPSIAGATHTFSSTEVYEIGDTITATCHASYLLELDVTEQTVTCQNNGWSYRGCVRVCLETPVVVNATTDHQHDMWEVGEVVTATCNGDLYFADAQVQTRAVKCTFNGWVVTPGCETVCKDQPVVVNATVDWSTTRMRKVGEAVTATCLPGHGITGARTETVQQVKCTDHDWEQKPACELLVCTDTPTVGNATVAWSPGLWLVGQVINATCLDGHRLLSDGSAVQELACTMDGWEVKPACEIACVDEPDFGNATSTWTSRLWLEGETVDATCAADHLDVNGNTQQTVECTESGWHDPSPCLYVPPGVIICTGEPEVTNAVTDWFVGVWVSGSSVNATCLQNHYALAEGGDVTVQTIACTDAGWENKSACVRVCEGSPGDFGVATTSWEDRKYQINETVFATCQDNYLLANDSVNQTVTCTESGWETPSPCLQVQCPAPVVSNSVETFNGTWNVSEEVVVTCLDDHFVRRGVQVQTLECGADRTWGEVLPCVRACDGEPLVQNANITWNESEFWTVGMYVVATCYPEYRVAGNFKSHHVTCTEGGWDEQTRCFMFTETTGPTTTTAPIVLPTMPPYDVSYPATTDYYWGTIHKGMEDVNGVEDNYEVTAGPFGFGQAISVSSDKEQCVKQSDYNIPSDECSGNPLDCDKGLSISVWEKPIFSDTVFEALNNSALATKKYVLSTGGDITGHPGVAIYHDGLYLVAVVSTGDEYWKLKVAGPLANDTWSNIAIRWEKPGADDGTLDEKTGGLEMFVNLKKVGHQVDSLSSAPAKDPLDPTEMMLGCHKDADNQQYRGFNDAEYDELATWTRKLPDNETLFFFGGYEANFSDIEPDKFQSMLTQVELKDPAQMAFAINILSKMTSTENVDPTTATPTEAASTSSSSGPTAGSPTASTTQSVQDAAEAAGVKQISTMRNIMKTMTNLNNINPDMPYTGFKSAMSLLDVASNLLGKDSFPKWRGLQSKKDEPGSAELVENLGNWLTTMAREVAFDNETEVIDYAKATDNIMVRVVKMMPEDLAKKGKYFETPNYKHPDISPHMDEWDLPYDRAVVPTDLFADARCMERPVSLTMQLFDTYDDVVPMKVNPATLRPLEENVIDARVIAIDVTVDLVRKPDGLIDPSAPDCKPDPDKLKETPVRYKLEHNIKEFSLRQLSFHSDEKQTEIRQRYCVWWNEDLGDFGVWDTTGCSLLKTTDEHTLCACDHFGTFSILAEKIEPKEVPEEKLWLTILRYVGYSLSFFCLIIYIVVIAFSGDLKEQFHLMGMNLSIAVLLGSICMLITDIPAVREDRHACTALGTLLHVFYLTAGAWIAALGHACFSAITSGVIGGRLRAYWFICWGFPLISMGLTYLLFLHDLGDDPRCFIAWENEPKYVFFSPQMLFVFFSFFFGTIVLCNLATPALRKDNLIDDYGTFCRGASFVMLFFDLIWTFGLLTYVRFGFRDPDFYPIFQVLNSWMGLMILLFIGMGSKRWRMVVLGQAKLRRKMLLGYEFGGSKPVDSEKERLGSPDDQRSKASSRPSSRPSSGRASPISASAVDMDRPPTAASDFPSRPASRGMVAGRPGSRMSSATT